MHKLVYPVIIAHPGKDINFHKLFLKLIFVPLTETSGHYKNRTLFSLGIQLEYFRYGQAGVLSLLDLHRTYVLAKVEHLRALLLYNLALADLEVAGESDQ